MKKLGILGGMSWESTSLYYQRLNQFVSQRLGGLHSANLVIESVDFERIQQWQHQQRWGLIADALAERCEHLQTAGAAAIVIATNTMHVIVPEIKKKIRVPILHISDAIGAELQANSLARPLLLGTQFTMQGDFIREPLEANFGQSIITPSAIEQKWVHDVIYQQLCKGIVSKPSKRQFLDIISRQGEQIDCVILGCTEIGMLLAPGDCQLPLFDTVELHCRYAVDWALP